MKNSTDQIDEKLGKIIFKFPVLHFGWEADCWGYVVEKDGTREVILSNHGKNYTASIEELNQKLSEYTKVKLDTKKAISLATNHKKHA